MKSNFDDYYYARIKKNLVKGFFKGLGKLLLACLLVGMIGGILAIPYYIGYEKAKTEILLNPVTVQAPQPADKEWALNKIPVGIKVLVKQHGRLQKGVIIDNNSKLLKEWPYIVEFNNADEDDFNRNEFIKVYDYNWTSSLTSY